MGMAQSSPRPSTRGLTRSLKVNLPTPWDLKTAYGQKARRQLHLTRRPEACRGSRCDAHIQFPAPVSVGKKKSANRTRATGRSRTTITHEVVDLVGQVPHPIMLTDKAALIRNLGATRLSLHGSNHEKHTGIPCIDRESP